MRGEVPHFVDVLDNALLDVANLNLENKQEAGVTPKKGLKGQKEEEKEFSLPIYVYNSPVCYSVYTVWLPNWTQSTSLFFIYMVSLLSIDKEKSSN